MLIEKTYLADGIYFDFDGFSIVLTTENGFSVTNRIVFDPEAMTMLDSARRSLDERIRAEYPESTIRYAPRNQGGALDL